MRLIVTIVSLAVVAYAKPQGYNYASGVSGTTGGIGGFSSGGIGGGSGISGISTGSFGSSGGSLGGISGIGSGHGGFSSGGSSGGFIGGGSSSSGFVSGGGSGFNQGGAAGGFEAPLVHKQFITVSAPEDHDALEQSKHLVLGRPQKNYRVVFIKAPSSSSANVKLSAQYAPKEEKTVIYVLTKKDSALEVNDIATPAPTVPSKPEVFFIKYKTDAEASHAQRQIQAEYDKIEGTSEQIDGGVAPQQSVVGALGGGDGGHGSHGGHGGAGFVGSSGSSGSSGFIGSSGASGFTGGSIGSIGSSGFAGGSSGFTAGGSKGSTYLPPAVVV